MKIVAGEGKKERNFGRSGWGWAVRGGVVKWPRSGHSGSLGGGWNATIRGTASAQASLTQIVLVRLGLAKLRFGQTWSWPGQSWFGQRWPQSTSHLVFGGGAAAAIFRHWVHPA